MYADDKQKKAIAVSRLPSDLAESRSKKTDVHDLIKKDIIEGRWRPGTKLSISDMRKDYDVSLSPLREALSRLAATGFITSERQRGFRISDVSQAGLKDLNNVRTKLECWAICDAIDNSDKNWESDVIAAYHRLARTPYECNEQIGRVSAEWNRCHKEFHSALVSACKSTWLMRFRDILFDEMERYRNLSLEYTTKRRESTRKGGNRTASFEDEHQMMVQAILDGDKENACALITQHFQNTYEIVQSILDSDFDM
ncbi:FCD domain-containing protein (plasmid) [Leisingera sp. M527]|uniref:GntR family transcriptional regulator n=1 Tax=Leisingera sp. M527 TaxID=2867014 RepID=UPI0021A3C610|nr:FCD domain-containing protein [Leisingera sp. M527]UWQ35437.1 FCD domain-containing protein [Leisingera sp. M527]